MNKGWFKWGRYKWGGKRKCARLAPLTGNYQNTVQESAQISPSRLVTWLQLAFVADEIRPMAVHVPFIDITVVVDWPHYQRRYFWGKNLIRTTDSDSQKGLFLHALTRYLPTYQRKPVILPPYLPAQCKRRDNRP